MLLSWYWWWQTSMERVVVRGCFMVRMFFMARRYFMARGCSIVRRGYWRQLAITINLCSGRIQGEPGRSDGLAGVLG